MTGEAHADGPCDRGSVELSQSPRIHSQPHTPPAPTRCFRARSPQGTWMLRPPCPRLRGISIHSLKQSSFRKSKTVFLRSLFFQRYNFILTLARIEIGLMISTAFDPPIHREAFHLSFTHNRNYDSQSVFVRTSIIP